MVDPSQAIPASDPVPRVLAWLRAHPRVLALAGGPDHIGLYNRPPWPQVTVVDPVGGGLAGGVAWLVERELQLEALGDLDGGPGKAVLSQLIGTVAGALVELPQQQTPAEGPVITAVRVDSAGGWSPLADGQPRYVATVRVWSHPHRVNG